MVPSPSPSSTKSPEAAPEIRNQVAVTQVVPELGSETGRGDGLLVHHQACGQWELSPRRGWLGDIAPCIPGLSHPVGGAPSCFLSLGTRWLRGGPWGKGTGTGYGCDGPWQSVCGLSCCWGDHTCMWAHLPMGCTCTGGHGANNMVTAAWAPLCHPVSAHSMGKWLGEYCDHGTLFVPLLLTLK